MNRIGLTMVIPLVLLATLATAPIMITEDAFARYQRHTGSGNLNQAASITNSCLNPASNSNTNDNMINNGNCGGTISQQGKSEQASIPTTIQNANPNIEVQRSTSTQPPMTPNPDSSTTLQVSFACATGFGSCPSSVQANITIGGNNPQPRTFILTNGDIQPVTLGAGNYTVSELPLSNPNHVGFSGNCKPSGGNALTANGTIAAGHTQHCSILNVI
jgi:hypothetical protein